MDTPQMPQVPTSYRVKLPPGMSLLLLVAGGFGAYFLWQTVKPKEDPKGSDEPIKEAEKDINKRKLTFKTESQYTAIAETIDQSFSGAYEEEEKVVDAVRKMQNPDDWRMLVVKFGIREYRMWVDYNLIEAINAFADEERYFIPIKNHLESIGVYDF